MKKLVGKIILAIILSFMSCTVQASTTVDPAVAFVGKLGDTALMSLTKKDFTRGEREKRVREILKNNFNVNTIARFAMGVYWRAATKVQQDEYLNLFEDMIVQTYTTRFEDYSGQKLVVGAAVKSGKRDTLVSSQIVQKDGPPINIEWRVRSKKGDLRIIDVVVEGISMSVTQRSDFSAVIQGSGGDINALLTILRERKKEAAQKT